MEVARLLNPGTPAHNLNTPTLTSHPVDKPTTAHTPFASYFSSSRASWSLGPAVTLPSILSTSQEQAHKLLAEATAFTRREVAAFKETAFPNDDGQNIIPQVPFAFFRGFMGAIKPSERAVATAPPMTTSSNLEATSSDAPVTRLPLSFRRSRAPSPSSPRLLVSQKFSNAAEPAQSKASLRSIYKAAPVKDSMRNIHKQLKSSTFSTPGPAQPYPAQPYSMLWYPNRTLTLPITTSTPHRRRSSLSGLPTSTSSGYRFGAHYQQQGFF
ncbi:hypothetical protein B0H19DRAFT_210537 [Mycena capillaripes]|nr:hypothetical protein B0H19DRAFT_210537 [Mycena capillaripes]